jgi:hypothetical protein
MTLKYSIGGMLLVLYLFGCGKKTDQLEAFLAASDKHVEYSLQQLDMSLDVHTIKYGNGKWERYLAKKFREKDSVYRELRSNYRDSTINYFLLLNDSTKLFRHKTNQAYLKDLGVNSSSEFYDSLHKHNKQLYQQYLKTNLHKIKRLYLMLTDISYCGFFGRLNVKGFRQSNDSVALGFVLDRTSQYGKVADARLNGREYPVEMKNTSEFTPIDFSFHKNDEVELEVYIPHTDDDAYSVYPFGWNYE